MLVYDLNIKIDKDIHEEWVEWMQQVYIPKAIESNHFEYCRVFKHQRNEKGGKTYSFHFYVKSFEDMEAFLDNEEIPLLEEHQNKFRGRYFLTKSYLDFLDEIS